MKKIFAVLLTVCVILCSAVCYASAGYVAKDDAPSTQAQSGTQPSNSFIGQILKGLLGDAAENLSNDELGQIAKKLFGDINISSLFGSGSQSVISEILEYLNALETTTDTVPATKPHSSTTEPESETPATTEPPTTKKQEEKTTKKKSTPQTTAKPIEHYYYYYIEATTVPVQTEEPTTATYEYIPPATIYTDLLAPTAVAGADTVDTSDGFGVKTVLGIIIILGSGVAVVLLCMRKKNSYL